MGKRFVTICFRSIRTDWFILKKPQLQGLPFVLATPDHGRMVITASGYLAQSQGADIGMTVADAKALIPSLQVLDDDLSLSSHLLKRLAIWCIRYTPAVGVHENESLLLDVTGCTHLWGSEELYLNDIVTKIRKLGFHVQAAIADTIGCSWAAAHFEKGDCIIEKGQQIMSLLSLPPEALRIESGIVERLYKLGLNRVSYLMQMPHAAIRRRFGHQVNKRLNQAIGHEEEFIQPVMPIEPYQVRLPCPDPITTATGIEIALERLLELMCKRLRNEEKGLRGAVLKCYRVDGKIETIEIGTNRPSHNAKHLFKLFELKIPAIEPALGIELFLLEAKKTEGAISKQGMIWQKTGVLDNNDLSELLDCIAGKIGIDHIHRYIPSEHYWPERSIKPALSLDENPATTWKTDRPRPLILLSTPERIDVTAPVPDYPPMNFRYKGKLYTITRSEGPERIEQEWWLQQGQHRDYYYVEDEQGKRYWLFRSGHYDDKTYQWFIHGFFA